MVQGYLNLDPDVTNVDTDVHHMTYGHIIMISYHHTYNWCWDAILQVLTQMSTATELRAQQ